MLAKKLQVKSGTRVAVLDPPAGVDLMWPADVVRSTRGEADVVLAFAKNSRALAGVLPKATKRVVDSGILWVAYPKAGQLETDLNRDILARALIAEGLEPVSQVAIDAVWSALRFKRDAALSAARRARGAFTTKPASKSSGVKKPAAKRAVAKGTAR
jgi:hypothetical protein